MANAKRNRSNRNDRDQRHSASPSVRPGQQYLAARRALLDGLSVPDGMIADSRSVLEHLERFNKSFQRTILEPLLNDALASPNTMTRALLFAAAEVTQRLHELSPPVMRSMGVVSRRSVPRLDTAPMDVVQQQLELIDRLITIKRAVTRRKR